MNTTEKIRAEIERRKKENMCVDLPMSIGRYYEDRDLLSFLDTLEEPEQPTRGYDEAYLNEKIAKASKSWKGIDVDKYMDEVRGREQPVMDCNDLEEAAEKYSDKYCRFGPIAFEYEDAFKAGAEWQEKRWENNRLMAQDHATEEECQREMDFVDNHIKKHHRIPTFSDAINYGIEWQKKQMPLPEDTLIFRKGVEEGKRLMMEEAENGKELLYVCDKSYKIGYRDGKRDAEQKQKGGNK